MVGASRGTATSGRSGSRPTARAGWSRNKVSGSRMGHRGPGRLLEPTSAGHERRDPFGPGTTAMHQPDHSSHPSGLPPGERGTRALPSSIPSPASGRPDSAASSPSTPTASSTHGGWCTEESSSMITAVFPRPGPLRAAWAEWKKSPISPRNEVSCGPPPEGDRRPTGGPCRTPLKIYRELRRRPIDDGRREDVLAASYLEVWWLAGRHTDPFDIVEWIVGIARRRLPDACLGPDSPTAPVKTGGPVPGYASQELAAMLHRTVDIPEPG